MITHVCELVQANFLFQRMVECFDNILRNIFERHALETLYRLTTVDGKNELTLRVILGELSLVEDYIDAFFQSIYKWHGNMALLYHDVATYKYLLVSHLLRLWIDLVIQPSNYDFHSWAQVTAISAYIHDSI